MPTKPLTTAGPGRPKGVPNKATIAVKEWAQGVCGDEQVRTKTLELARSGKLHPSIFNELLHYAYGKPKDTTVVEGSISIDQVTDAKRSLASLLGRLAERAAADGVAGQSL